MILNYFYRVIECIWVVFESTFSVLYDPLIRQCHHSEAVLNTYDRQGIMIETLQTPANLTQIVIFGPRGDPISVPDLLRRPGPSRQL